MMQRVTTREKILDAAMEVALREGIDRLSIRKVASACGIAVGSVYNYCSSRQELGVAVAERFWEQVFADQEQLYYGAMGFTKFLGQYYQFLYGRLSRYDGSWLRDVESPIPQKMAVPLMRKVLAADRNVRRFIWNMDLNEDAFCGYVFINVMALLRAGENNCRFFIFLLEHLLYKE